jgi:hypothetical protein
MRSAVTDRRYRTYETTSPEAEVQKKPPAEAGGLLK